VNHKDYLVSNDMMLMHVIEKDFEASSCGLF